MKRFQGVFLAVLALVVSGQLYAQPAPSPAADPATPAPKANVKLSGAEMQAQVATLETNIRVDYQHVTALQATARQEKDVIKLSCINDRMVKLKAESNLFDQAKLQLLGVLEKDERFAAYAEVTAAADRVHKQREEADACAGKVDLQNENDNDFTAPEIPDDPTASVPFDDITTGGSMEPPGYASPYN